MPCSIPTAASRLHMILRPMIPMRGGRRHSLELAAPALWGWLIVVLFGGLASFETASAERQQFLLNDPQKLGAANITIESQIRPLRGFLTEFDGIVRFDPEKPESIDGDIKISLANLRVGSYLVTEVLISDRCLDTAKYPQIKFNVKGIEDLKQYSENSWSFTAKSAMVMKGRAGAVDFPATLVYVPDGMTERTDGKIVGDLIVLRGELSFQPALWGVTAETGLIGEIGGVVEIDFSTIGYTIKSMRD